MMLNNARVHVLLNMFLWSCPDCAKLPHCRSDESWSFEVSGKDERSWPTTKSVRNSTDTFCYCKTVSNRPQKYGKHVRRVFCSSWLFNIIMGYLVVLIIPKLILTPGHIAILFGTFLERPNM